MSLTNIKNSLFCLGLLIIASAFAYRNPVSPAKLEKALLWQISGKGLAKPSYLYGTIHVICPTDMIMTEKMQATLKSTEQLSLEIDMDEPNMMVAMMQAITMKDGATLKSLLSEDEYQKVSAYFQEQLKMDLTMVQNWKPIMVTSLLYTKVADCTPQSYEATFMKMAKEQGKEVIGVETIAEQMAVFDKIPYKKQAEMLLEGITDMDKSKKEFDQMITAYKQQDLDGFQKLFKESSQGLDKYADILLVQRNKNWIPVIEREANEKPTFFAVGAGHLGGEQGVIQLLRQQGYTVKPAI